MGDGNGCGVTGKSLEGEQQPDLDVGDGLMVTGMTEIVDGSAVTQWGADAYRRTRTTFHCSSQGEASV